MSRCPACHRRLRSGMPCPQHAVHAAADTGAAASRPEVPGYAVGELLGAGGYASVWAARAADGTPIALKLARSAEPRVVARFEREAEAIARVGPPHVPALLGAGRDPDGRPYLALERLDGETLADRLGGLARPPSGPEIHELADAVLAGLAAVHEAGIVHRDLKPENVILQAGRARLIDFGLAMQPSATQELTLAGHAVGTLAYMAPEQLRPGAAIDARTDVYAFGVLLFELCTLRPPFVGDAAAIEHGHLHLRPPRAGALVDDAVPFEPLIARCLAKLPDRRPADARELRRELAAARSTAGPVATGGSASVRLGSDVRPVVLVAVAARAGVALVTETANRRGGFVAKQRGEHVVCAFLSMGGEDAIDAACDAALELLERSGLAVGVHVASLRVRRRRGVAAVFGEEVEHPERWLPAQPWSGVLATEAAASLTPRAEPGELEGFSRLGIGTVDRGRQLALIGRTAVMEQMRDRIQACLASRLPSLVTVLGDRGLGKSRIAQELVTSLGRQRVVRVIRVRARGAAAASAVTQLVDELGALGDDARELLAEVTPGMTPQEAVRTLGAALVRIARSGPLVLVMDDADRAEGGLLDAIEYAALDHADAALAIVLLAGPRLDELRPSWGRAAHRHERIALEPLAIADAITLVAEAFGPADYVPRELLERLARWAGCNPLHILDVVETLDRAGAIRERTVSRSRYLDLSSLERLVSSRVEDWLVARTVAALPEELGELARLCAVLGDELEMEEVDRVQAALAGEVATADPELGLGALARAGLVEPSGPGRVRFRNPALRAALYRTIPEPARRRIHALAAAFWDDRTDESSRAVYARHAAAAGLSRRAGEELLRLGEAALARHAYVSAEAQLSAALELVDDPDARRIALAGRALARRASYRTEDALADLREARRLAEAAGDAIALADLLVEEATLLDLAERFDEAQACVSAAAHQVARASTAPPALAAKLVLAHGRCRWRAEDVEGAVELLSRAVALAEVAGEHETRAIALVLLAPALVLAQRTGEAAARFEEAIATCIERSDLLHLAAAYVNRLFLWTSMQQPDHAVRDLQHAVQIAREIGHPLPERAATHNLAELLYWRGVYDEAHRLASRSRSLQERMFERAVAEDGLLLARIHFARGELADARVQLDWIDREHGTEVSPTVRLLSAAIRLALDELDAGRPPSAPAAWDDLEREGAPALPGEERVELLWLRARAARARGRDGEADGALTRARELVVEAPIWERQLAAPRGPEGPLRVVDADHR